MTRWSETRRRRGPRRLVLGGAAVLVAATIVAGFRPERSSEVEPVPYVEVAIPDAAAERLAGAIRIPTVSHADPSSFDSAAFQALHAYLATAYPRLHAQLKREAVAGYSLLYTWPGSDPSLQPVLLMGHLDVVPVEPGTEHRWEETPFSGRVAGGFIWGRGSIDNKSAVLGTMESVEMLLGEGFQPKRTVYLAYGHDEEVGGTRGASAIAALLERRGVKLDLVLDEGGVIGEGIMPGVSAPTALVGIAEKGFASIELTASAAGGHSSLPPRHGAIGILAAAIVRLEANPLPARLERPTRQLFERIAPQLSYTQRVVFANLWLTRPLVLRKLAASPTTNAMVRTTTAATIFEAGTKENVLPTRARAVVNFRILPGDSVAGVLDHVRAAIADPRVAVRLADGFIAEPSAVSSTESRGFRMLERTIRAVAPDAIVAPYLVVVVTDARYYGRLSSSVLRFLPVRLDSGDLDRMHGINERISIRDYEGAIRFYRQLILNTAAS